MHAAREFKSPVRKLLRFFQRSRDNWKRKQQEWKRRYQSLSSQHRAVEASREHWKKIALQQRLELRELRKQLETVKSHNLAI